jgi:hypothetical protein
MFEVIQESPHVHGKEICKQLIGPARKYLRAEDFTLEQRKKLFIHEGICLRGETLESTMGMLSYMVIMCRVEPADYVSDLIHGINNYSGLLPMELLDQLSFAAEHWSSERLRNAVSARA